MAGLFRCRSEPARNCPDPAGANGRQIVTNVPARGCGPSKSRDGRQLHARTGQALPILSVNGRPNVPMPRRPPRVARPPDQPHRHPATVSMQTASLHLSADEFDDADFRPLQRIGPHLVLAFLSIAAVRDGSRIARLQQAFSGTRLVGCTTAGEIAADGVSADGAALVAIRFDQPHFRAVSAALPTMDASAGAGAVLARQLAAPDLRSVIVFAPGVAINGSALIKGLVDGVGPQVTITGGLAGDGGAFTQTWTLLDDRLDSQQVVAIGLYGDAVRVAH
ncbi:MAG: hypothetical protein OEW27_11880, partial [Aquincola sp.]|nr:hypothetical protein [Aquincola sp.]